MIRLTAMLRRHESMTPEEFRAHWSTTHAELIRSTPGVAEHILRYEQHPRLAGAPGEWTGGDHDGITVQWFESRAAFEAMLRRAGLPGARRPRRAAPARLRAQRLPAHRRAPGDHRRLSLGPVALSGTRG